MIKAETRQTERARVTVREIRRQIDDMPVTQSERWVDKKLEQLAEAELLERLAASAAWRA